MRFVFKAHFSDANFVNESNETDDSEATTDGEGGGFS